MPDIRALTCVWPQLAVEVRLRAFLELQATDPALTARSESDELAAHRSRWYREALDDVRYYVMDGNPLTEGEAA